MKLISWNVNGIRAALKKGLLDYINEEDPDVICFQETKAEQGQAEINLPQYTEYWHSAKKKGYSGTAIFTKQKALAVTNGLNNGGKLAAFEDKYGDANNEGRVIAAEFEKFFLVNVYTPNSKGDLSRLDFRHKFWDPQFLNYVKELEKVKPVIFCGDLNVAHTEIDLARPDTNHHNHGFTDEEREGFGNFLKAGFVDIFREFHPGEVGQYTWWSPFAGARQRNVGWRIDYFLVSKALEGKVTQAFIRPEIKGSDHCPVGVVLDL